MDWTADRIDLLKQLASEGLSAAKIAERLGGVTRNAVIGKLHRLDRPQAAAGAAPRPSKPAPRAKPPSPAAAGRPAAAEPAAPRLRERKEAPGSATFLSLTAGMCRWPIGDPSSRDFSFCGAQACHGPYCARHSRLAYRAAPAAPDGGREFRRLMAL